MKRNFYGRLLDILNNHEEVCIITVIKGIFRGKDIIGQKLLKNNMGVLLEDESLSEFWNEVLKEISIIKNTCILKLDDDIEVFIECVVGKPSLIVCGGGHVGLALCKMAKLLNFHTTIIDEREEFASNERFVMADRIICESFNKAINNIKFSSNTYIIIVTRGHEEDKKCLESVINKENAYIGMMGSKRKVKMIFDSLLASGYNKESIENIYTPIGIDLGSETPEEIALSIMAQVVWVKNKKVRGEIDQSTIEAIRSLKGNMLFATIIEKNGSSPRGVGAKMLVHENGTCIGTIGGGKIENVVYKRALELIREEESCTEFYDLTNSKNSNLKMACGGSVKVLFEFIKNNRI